jgi:hypothetical protein
MECAFGDYLPGETPLRDWSGLKTPGIKTRQQLNVAEAKNIRPVLVAYIIGNPTRKSAAFDLVWAKELHREIAADNGDYGPLVELHRPFIPMPHRPLGVQQQDNPAMRQPGKVITARTMLPPDAPPPRPVIVQQPDDPSILEPGNVIYRAGRPPLPPADE